MSAHVRDWVLICLFFLVSFWRNQTDCSHWTATLVSIEMTKICAESRNHPDVASVIESSPSIEGENDGHCCWDIRRSLVRSGTIKPWRCCDGVWV